MSKNNKNAPQKSIKNLSRVEFAVKNKKHIVRLEREKRQKSLLISLAVLLGVIIVGLVTFGLIKGLVIEPQKAVAEVNNTKITSDQFRTAAVFRRITNNNRYVTDAQVASYYSSLGFSAPDYLLIELYTIKYEMETPLFFGDKVVQSMIEDVLIEQEAEKAGIKVTDLEVSDSLLEDFGYYPEGTPTNEPTSTSITTPTFSKTQQALLATSTVAGPTSTKAPTSTTSPTAETTAASEEATAAPTSTPEPTATEYTLELYQSNFKSYTEFIGRFYLTENDLFENQKKGLFREKMYDLITQGVPSSAEQVWTQHILVATQEEADAILERLAAGENWKDLATELSLDTDTGYFSGDQGWFPRGIMGIEIETAAFSMKEIGETVVVSDSNGYHVIRLMGIDPARPILDTYMSLLRDATFSNWLEGLKANADITIYDTWKEKIPENPPLSNIDISSIQ